MLGVKIILTEIMGFATLGEYVTNRVENTGGPTISVSNNCNFYNSARGIWLQIQKKFIKRLPKSR